MKHWRTWQISLFSLISLFFISCTSFQNFVVLNPETFPLRIPIILNPTNMVSYLKISIHTNDYNAFLDTGADSCLYIDDAVAEREKIPFDFHIFFNTGAFGFNGILFKEYKIPQLTPPDFKSSGYGTSSQL